MLPFWLSDGSNPRATDARWVRWVKILSASNDICGSNVANHAGFNDTICVLQSKVWATVKQLVWTPDMQHKKTEWWRVADILDAYRSLCGGSANNAKRKTDRLRTLEQKILATVTGQTYNG